MVAALLTSSIHQSPHCTMQRHSVPSHTQPRPRPFHHSTPSPTCINRTIRLPAPPKENPTTPHPCAETDSAPQKSERGESNEVAPSRISPDRQKDEKMSFVTQPSPLGEEVAGTRSKTRVCKTPCKLQVKNNSGARKAESNKAVNACFVAGSEEFCREDEGGEKDSMGEA